MQVSLPFVQKLDHGIHLIDTGFQRPMFDASYLIVENGRAAFVDAGTNHSVPRLLAAVEAAGLQPDAVDFVIATHVHLDHAGGIGLLMTHLPNALLVVHPQGAPHMIDPARLMNGARAVYGDEEVARSYGDVVGVPAHRVIRTEDGFEIDLAGRVLEFMDTPGHARHHHCIWDERSRGFFTGDTFGLSYREFDTDQGAWAMPTTTPVQFEPEPLRNSVRRMLTYHPQCMYLTHYGRVTDVSRMAEVLFSQLDAMVALATAMPALVAPVDTAASDARQAALMQGFDAIHMKSLRDHGCTLSAERINELLQLDNVLNAQGMGIWLDRLNRPTR